ncbi:YlqD family protein [Bacillus horti]|uniref:YlqD protein n=1 Tax=Caldalkalibacillus horti TaxID=77523 RepID=A0ABT9W2R1_9BACI|nr:YlqD family protein [Bacillus horti]MDQ0167357.1 hypothetical protein [Bacillus horti]
MKIKRPVHIKVILTESSKKELETEYAEKLSQNKIELEQLRFQGKKLLHDAGKKGAEFVRSVQERLQQEEKKKQEYIEQVLFQIEQLELLPIGTEILHSTIEGDVDVRVGDSWDHLMNQTEIIIKDGVVHEIREGRDKVE